MAKPTPKLHDIVAIRFLDHVQGTDDVACYWVYGRVAKVTRESYTVDSWALQNPNSDREGERVNIEPFTILRGVIKEVLILKPAGETPANDPNQ